LVTVEQSRPDSVFPMRKGLTVDTTLAPALQPTIDLYMAAFDAGPTPTLLVDGDGRIVSSNAAMLQMLHVPPVLLIGTPWRLLLVSRHDDQAHPGQRPSRLDDLPYMLWDGVAERPMTVRWVSLQGQTGAALLLIEPRSPAPEPSTPTPSVDGTLLLDAAHELRSPLLALSLALSGLEGDSTAPRDPADDDRLVRSLQRSAVHLQTLVENLLDTARIGANLFAVDPRATLLTTIVHEAIHVVAPLLRTDEQRIVVEEVEPGLTVLADAQRMRQVLVNLLHNAIKYAASHEAIIVRVGANHGYVTVEVVDAGPGVPVDERVHLFTRYYRGASTRSTPGSGTGLGLAICKAIVEAHGGEIGVREGAGEKGGEGRGATFWFTLRLA